MVFPKDKSDLPFSQRPLGAARVEVNRPEQGTQGPPWQEPRILMSSPYSRQVPALPHTAQLRARVGRAHAPSTRNTQPSAVRLRQPHFLGGSWSQGLPAHFFPASPRHSVFHSHQPRTSRWRLSHFASFLAPQTVRTQQCPSPECRAPGSGSRVLCERQEPGYGEQAAERPVSFRLCPLGPQTPVWGQPVSRGHWHQVGKNSQVGTF